jgi:hypothetical protein
MSNVLSEDKRQQVLALGRLGWSLRQNRGSDFGSSGDGERLSEGGRGSGSWSGPAAEEPVKTGHHGGVHRP